MNLIENTIVEDTFAEAFDTYCVSLWITADDRYWLDVAIAGCTGYGTSVIGCDVEAGLSCYLDAAQTPDGRGGAEVMFFGFKKQSVIQAVQKRIAQTVMTCSTTRVFAADDIGGGDTFGLGDYLRYFGDGYEKQMTQFSRAGWQIPVTSGTFFCERNAQVHRGVAGGNLIVIGQDQATCLAAAKRGVLSVSGMRGVITPFPGGVVRCASKVGSKYRGLIASTNDQFCPEIQKEKNEISWDHRVVCVYEIVINGVDVDRVKQAMGVMIKQILFSAADDQIVRVTAANFDGKLGKHQIALAQCLEGGA